jgi:hypothetical protein
MRLPQVATVRVLLRALVTAITMGNQEFVRKHPVATKRALGHPESHRHVRQRPRPGRPIHLVVSCEPLPSLPNVQALRESPGCGYAPGV